MLRLVVVMVLCTSLSGCLAEDIWREPFDWGAPVEVGENIDGAQAFAGALGSLGEESQEEGDKVVQTADDLPDNVVFQNMRDFLNRQSPGRGDQVHDNITTATGTARDQYVTLTGPAAQALANATAPLVGLREPLSFQVADRATRVQVTLDIVLLQQPPEDGANPTPAGTVEVTLTDPHGAVRLSKEFDTSRHYEDMFVVGTYGGDNEVREHWGGTWTLDVQAKGEGAWAAGLSAFEPRYDDYEWWQFWRGEKRVVVGE